MIRGPALTWILGVVAGVLVIGALGYGGYRYWLLSKEYTNTSATLASSTLQLAKANLENVSLNDQLSAEVARNNVFETQINGMENSLGTLTKLSQTDPQLLQKYSKIYFLNENYVPAALATITPAYTLDTSRTYLFLTQAKTSLENMLADAENAGAPILVLSAYRSFGQQVALKTSYKTTYGKGANSFSADQGYSEHQLGTAVDLTTKEIANTSIAFAKTPAYDWLTNNAYRYGFVLSYPPNNTFYQYEHWRFIGIELATYLHDHNQHFYDLDQRFIDTYLVSIF
jgi:LAS superfamily LD-carboxypeptidase LdcB